MRRTDEPQQTPIECPRCGEWLHDKSGASVLDSLRCDACGVMLAFDEVLALRSAAQARSSQYD
jgi:hypothetical protein